MAKRIPGVALTAILSLALLLASPTWTGSARAESLRVIPFPGTPDAAPRSDIIFTTLRPAEVLSVTVAGSRSGIHDGLLERLPAEAGTAFAPERPFQRGEFVRVTASVDSPQAGMAAGDPGATQLRFSFRVAESVPPPALDAPWSWPEGIEMAPWMSTTGHGPTQSFRSEPNLHPPVVKVTPDPDTTSGDIFIAPQNSPQVGPMILSPRGQLLWFTRTPAGTDAGPFAVQRYHGRPVLTWWYGRVGEDWIHNPSGDVIMDRSYRRVAVVHAGYGYTTDEHDFQLTARGTAYLDAQVLTEANLTSVGGPARGPIADNVIQEVDVKTGKVLWEWHALGHVPVSASYQAYSSSSPFYDYFHLNSIQPLPGGNLLISARDTCAVYEISRSTGKVIWTLGGRYSDFKMEPDTAFWWQHDARLSGDSLSLLDDGALPQEQPQSSAKFLRIDRATHTVWLIKRITHSPPLLASAGGSVQTLPNGNVFTGWGTQPDFSEYTPAGRQIFNGSFALNVASYRALRFPWVGAPRTRPSLAVAADSDGRVTAYVSWNGATQVAKWRVLGGSTSHGLRPLTVTARRTGFETAIGVSGASRYLAVQAIASNGRVLGTSRVRPDPRHVMSGRKPAKAEPTQHFHSAPELRPPTVTATADPDRESGEIFLAPQNTAQVGPMILNSQGQLVWFDPLRKGSQTYYASNFEVQRYQGRPVLTWWQGKDLDVGEDVIMNRSYHKVAVVHAADGDQADLHEFQITPQGTALIDAVTPRHANLSSAGGPVHGNLLDNVIQEIDIKTDKLIWQWDAASHVPVSASYQPYPTKTSWYDAFHLNSIDQLADGNLLISLRNTWALYEISRRTGKIIWTLGGKSSDFTLGPGARFEWQHDARMHRRGILSVFDDATSGPGLQEEGQSSGKLLRVDTASRTVSLVRRFTHTPPILTAAAGNVQVLPNGDVFVGWGKQPDFSEYSPSGRQLFTGSFPFGVGSYRALRFPWVGEPQTRPALAVSRGANARMKLYASWNGATQVKAWRVLGGPDRRELKGLGVTAPRTGFETMIQLLSGPRYVAVQALGPDGKVLSTSAAARS